MILADLSARKRLDVVKLALDWTLADLPGPVSTAELVALLARRLDTDERPAIARLLMQLAPLTPTAARSSVMFKRYGRDMTPWVWSPAPRLTQAKAEPKVLADPAATHYIDLDTPIQPARTT